VEEEDAQREEKDKQGQKWQKEEDVTWVGDVTLLWN